MDYELEECRAGGWKARFDPERFKDIAERIREKEDIDADTEHMLVWHHEDVKCSLVRSSGVMMVRTEREGDAQEIVQDFV